MKEVCLQAIRSGSKKVEVRYPIVFPNVFLTYIGDAAGFRVRSEPLFDIYEFCAYELLAAIEKQGAETGSTA